jgi:hypothetical protein
MLLYRVDRFTLTCVAMSCTGASFERSNVRIVFSSLGLNFSAGHHCGPARRLETVKRTFAKRLRIIDFAIHFARDLGRLEIKFLDPITVCLSQSFSVARQSSRINPLIRENSRPLDVTMTRPRRSAVPAIMTS